MPESSTVTSEGHPSSVPPIDFPPVDIVDMQDSAHSCYILQKLIEGTFEKFNTNSGIVCSRSPLSDALQAFSHFTYVKSGQSLLICDLQGVQTPSGTQLLDPAIHSKVGTNCYGPTDLGYRGIERFFRNPETCTQRLFVMCMYIVYHQCYRTSVIH